MHSAGITDVKAARQCPDSTERRSHLAGTLGVKVAAAIAEKRRNNEEIVEHHAVVSQEEWLKQRLKLMEKEKQHMRAGG